jgi:hypothetical protein
MDVHIVLNYLQIPLILRETGYPPLYELRKMCVSYRGILHVNLNLIYRQKNTRFCIKRSLK